MNFINLGLPSGTLWAERNEEGFYTFDDAVKKYGDNIPSKEQWEELLNECQWKWNGKGYNVTGHNGNMIVLSAAGVLNCDGCASYVGYYGAYCSSTPSGSNNAWGIILNNCNADVDDDDRCYHGSVRLVKK